MTSNTAAETTQHVRRLLTERGWREVKSQHFQFPLAPGGQAPFAVEVGYVLGECTVKIIPIDQRGAEGEMHARGKPVIYRGVGTEFYSTVLQALMRIEAGIK
jgi:hypothetical protein